MDQGAVRRPKGNAPSNCRHAFPLGAERPFECAVHAQPCWPAAVAWTLTATLRRCQRLEQNMKTIAAVLLVGGASIFAAFGAADTSTPSSPSLSELREKGVFEFPQKRARVFCNQPDLRFSVWSNEEFLFVQAVLWADDDASLGKTSDNREIGDWSKLLLDLDADGEVTPQMSVVNSGGTQ